MCGEGGILLVIHGFHRCDRKPGACFRTLPLNLRLFMPRIEHIFDRVGVLRLEPVSLPYQPGEEPDDFQPKGKAREKV